MTLETENFNSGYSGWRYYFNSYTIRGRSNITYTTYALTALAILALNRRIKRNRALREAAVEKK